MEGLLKVSYKRTGWLISFITSRGKNCSEIVKRACFFNRYLRVKSLVCFDGIKSNIHQLSHLIGCWLLIYYWSKLFIHSWILFSVQEFENGSEVLVDIGVVSSVRNQRGNKT